MFSHFQPEKAVQAAAVLLRAQGSREMDYMRLLKLLYIADRESLKRIGRPIIGNKPVAMKNGPLHSGVYDLIKGTHPNEGAWSKYIARVGYTVRQIEDPGVLELSEIEIEILNDVVDRYHTSTTWDLVELSHTFGEWEKNYVEGTSTPIPLEDILVGVGLSSDAIAEMLKDFQESQADDEVLPRRPTLVPW